MVYKQSLQEWIAAFRQLMFTLPTATLQTAQNRRYPKKMDKEGLSYS